MLRYAEVMVDGRRIYYATEGDGAPLLLRGRGSSARQCGARYRLGRERALGAVPPRPVRQEA